MKKLTISEIAQLAGVSQATVSRVLNGYPHIRPEMREKVQKVIEETGFQPHNVARLLASNRSNLIGLVIPSGANAVFTDPYFPALTEGISKVANQLQQTLALFIFHSMEDGDKTIKSILSTGLVDGVIITADRKDEPLIKQLQAAGMPFVVVGQIAGMDNLNFIDTDNLQGGYAATKHLIDLGYQRIAVIVSNENRSGDDRYLGYEKALTEATFPIETGLIGYGDYSLESAYRAMKLILAEKPDAVFVSSDTMALGAIRAIREAGLNVPNDVAVVGYDDLPPAMQADPPLTTVRQPVEKTGSLAVETLMELIAKPERPARQIILPNELIVRASCGAVQLSV